jgi:hypothetical protein
METPMRKEDLIALLERLPAGADVRIVRPTHDYWRTELAIDPRMVGEEQVKVSDYHGLRDAITDKEWDSDLQTVYVIR